MIAFIKFGDMEVINYRITEYYYCEISKDISISKLF